MYCWRQELLFIREKNGFKENDEEPLDQRGRRATVSVKKVNNLHAELPYVYADIYAYCIFLVLYRFANLIPVFSVVLLTVAVSLSLYLCLVITFLSLSSFFDVWNTLMRFLIR